MAKSVDLLRPDRKVSVEGKSYVVENLIARGGSGEVYKVRLGERAFALKVFFPFYQLNLFHASSSVLPRTIKESLAFQRKEYDFLTRLSHPNIVRVYGAGDIMLTKTDQRSIPIKEIESLPTILMDFVEGRPLKEALHEFPLGAEQFGHILLRVAKALEYLHADRSYMHADIKSANILIRKVDGEPILIDFALCKNLNFAEVSPSERTRLLGDWDLFPKDLATDHQLKAIKEKDGTREDIFKFCFPYLDLFQFGKLLTVLHASFASILDERETSYLDELAAQLSDWAIVAKWGPRDLAPKIERLGPQHFAAFGVPELTPASSAERTIVLPPGIAVPTTRRIEQIINNRSFRRLSTIHQLALLSLVYPGADYKRWAHVLFAYEQARQFVTHLYSSSLFRVMFDKRATQQLLAVVLLHDINHFPFLHIFQESNIPNLNRLEVVDLFCKGEVTGETAAGRPSIYDLLSDIGVEPERFKRLVFSKHHEQLGPTIEVDHTISSLINSGVDVDKLSYLFLDSHFTGVRYGSGIDFPTVLQAATLGRLAETKALHIGFTDRAIQALENVVMTRYWNFRSIYWHHTNRAIMAMILGVVRRLYVERKREVREYLLDTMWVSDIEAIRYLDSQYTKEIGEASVLSGIIEDRDRIFKRLYTVRAGMGDASDDSLYADCRALNHETELIFRKKVAEGLRDLLSAPSPLVSAEDVLVDIPRRDMDSGGAVYVSTGSRLEPLARFSDPIRSISGNYELLTKRVRIFVSPRIAIYFSKNRRLQDREILKSTIKTAMKLANVTSQVQ